MMKKVLFALSLLLAVPLAAQQPANDPPTPRGSAAPQKPPTVADLQLQNAELRLQIAQLKQQLLMLQNVIVQNEMAQAQSDVSAAEKAGAGSGAAIPSTPPVTQGASAAVQKPAKR